MSLCPHCRCYMKQVGRYVQAQDEAGQNFVFAVCACCSVRLTRLPLPQQIRAHDRAARLLAAHPERYWLRTFDTEVEARLYATLEAEAAR